MRELWTAVSWIGFIGLFGLQLQLQGGGGGRVPFPSCFPLQRQRPDKRATCAPFRFRITATSRVCFSRNRNGGLGVDWRIMGRVDSMRCGLSPERLQGVKFWQG